MQTNENDSRIREWVKQGILPFVVAILVSIGNRIEQQGELEEKIEALRTESVARLRHDSRGFQHPEVDAGVTAHVRRLTEHLVTRDEWRRRWDVVRQLNPTLTLPQWEDH